MNQDPELFNNPNGATNFLIKLSSDDELVFTFSLVIRQSSHSALSDGKQAVDTNISGLTFVCGSTPREVANLVTREFHADPNLHKNANVDLVGDYGTGGSSSVTFEWTWKWKPPKPVEDKGGGWRNSCSVRNSPSLDTCVPERVAADTIYALSLSNTILERIV